MELDILRCGYSRQLVHSIYLHWICESIPLFCLIFSNFPLQRKITLVSMQATLLQLEMKISPRLCISRNFYIGNLYRKCLERACFCLSHLIKKKMINFSLR